MKQSWDENSWWASTGLFMIRVLSRLFFTLWVKREHLLWVKWIDTYTWINFNSSHFFCSLSHSFYILFGNLWLSHFYCLLYKIAEKIKMNTSMLFIQLKQVNKCLLHILHMKLFKMFFFSFLIFVHHINAKPYSKSILSILITSSCTHSNHFIEFQQ